MGQTGAYSATQDFANVQIQTEKVADNVFMLIGAGGNIGVSTGKDCVLMMYGNQNKQGVSGKPEEDSNVNRDNHKHM